MKPVFQTVIYKGKGNCMQAAIASLLELELEQVPNFILYGKDWFGIYECFMRYFGYEINGVEKNLKIGSPINGCFYASVESKLFENTTHAVLINDDGVVVHDPNPQGLYLGENVIETGAMNFYTNFERIEK